MMKPLLYPLLAATLLLPVSTVDAASPPTAHKLPTISSKTKAGQLKGTFDRTGLSAWYFDSSAYTKSATHIEFDTTRSFDASVFSTYADFVNGQTYPRYDQILNNALIFPLSWNKRQYLVLQGTPGKTFTVPIHLRTLAPLLPMKSNTSQAAAKSLIVKTKRGGSLKQSLFKTLGVTSRALLADELQLERLTFATPKQAQRAKDRLLASSAIAFVEYDQTVHSSGDVFKKYQWSLDNTGQRQGKIGADIGFSAMQKFIQSKPLKTTLVAVVDTGVNASYADFSGRVRTDLGYDFVRKTKYVLDEQGHGTHVAGIIAATGNNTYGMTGINPKASIIPVKVLDGNGEGTTSNLVRGILHAVKSGAKVINLSLGMPSSSKALEDAITYAHKKNVIIVAASGNESKRTLAYPSLLKDVISVGATDRRDVRASFSNYGTGLDLVAPGVEIPSYIGDGELAFASGTSMATPHVAAVASLLVSLKPTLSATEVERLLKLSAKDLGQKGYDTSYGYGRLDAARAVQAVK